MSTSETLRSRIGHMRPDEPQQVCSRCGERKPETCFKTKGHGRRLKACKSCTVESPHRKQRSTAHFARMGYA